MKALAVGLSGAALLALAAGCSPQLAQTELGDQEMQWNNIVRESYPGFRPPQTAPPGVKDKNTPLQSVVPESELQPAPTDETEMVETVTNEAVEDVSGKQEVVKDTVIVDETVDAVVPPVEEPKPEVKFTEYVVKPGDTLSGIAKKFYKDGRLYDRIYEANKSVIPNPNRLPMGLKIRIPQQ